MAVFLSIILAASWSWVSISGTAGSSLDMLSWLGISLDRGWDDMLSVRWSLLEFDLKIEINLARTHRTAGQL